jgi:ribosomal protein S24E
MLCRNAYHNFKSREPHIYVVITHQNRATVQVNELKHALAAERTRFTSEVLYTIYTH